MLIGSIQRIPVLGPTSAKIYRLLVPKKPFTTSGNYWEERYKSGGNSGSGSYNNLAEFKGEVINEFIARKSINSVIEFGCGDGNQLKYYQVPSYLGFDISQNVIARCKAMFKDDSSKNFKIMEFYSGERADLTMSIDVIFHLIEDEVYHDYMTRLFGASDKYVIVYSSDADEHENNGISPHVKHRKFTSWVEKYAPAFKIVSHIPNKYPFDPKNKDRSSYADFYFFEKEG